MSMSEPMNPKSMARTVLPCEYEPISSSYLSADRRLEKWHINHIEWDGQVLRASARLEGAGALRQMVSAFICRSFPLVKLMLSLQLSVCI